MSESFNLFRLQQLDLNRMKIRRRQREIEKILNADESVQKAQQMLDANHQELEKATHAYNEIHDQVEERNLKLKYSQAKLFGGQITNPQRTAGSGSRKRGTQKLPLRTGRATILRA